MFLIQTVPGSVVALPDDPVAQCDARILGFTNDDPIRSRIQFDVERSIVTRVTLSQQVNVQFAHMLGNLVYVYVFGDRMGQMTLSGLSFTCPCAPNQQTGRTAATTLPVVGAEQMLLWYKRNRSSRRASPIRLTIGKSAVEGFVTSFTEDVVDQSLNLVQWNVTMASLPGDD